MLEDIYIIYIYRNQDIRIYYGIYHIYPLKSIILIFSILRLSGFSFLVGYYSKDLIIEYFFFRKIVYFSIINLIVGTIFIISYSFRIIFGYNISIESEKNSFLAVK